MGRNESLPFLTALFFSPFRILSESGTRSIAIFGSSRRNRWSVGNGLWLSPPVGVGTDELSKIGRRQDSDDADQRGRCVWHTCARKPSGKSERRGIDRGSVEILVFHIHCGWHPGRIVRKVGVQSLVEFGPSEWCRIR